MAQGREGLGRRGHGGLAYASFTMTGFCKHAGTCPSHHPELVERERFQDNVRDLDFRLVALLWLTDSDDDAAHMVWYCTYASFFCNAGHTEGTVATAGVTALKAIGMAYWWQ